MLTKYNTDINDIILCIDEYLLYITKGKTYEVLNVEKKWVFLINDKDRIKDYPLDSFKMWLKDY